jgi:MFS family permease
LLLGSFSNVMQRFCRKWIIVLGLVGSSICLLGTAGVKSIEEMIVARGATALMSSAIFPISNRIIADILPPSSRSRATVSIPMRQFGSSQLS